MFDSDRQRAEDLQRPLPNTVYSPIVLEHMQNPRNWGILDHADGYARITGPCGDTMKISLVVKNNRIIMCTFDTDGCGATVSCGSIVTEMAKGKTTSQVKMIDRTAILSYCKGLPPENEHCAQLAANTLQKALEEYEHIRNDSWKKIYRTR